MRKYDVSNVSQEHAIRLGLDATSGRRIGQPRDRVDRVQYASCLPFQVRVYVLRKNAK